MLTAGLFAGRKHAPLFGISVIYHSLFFQFSDAIRRRLSSTLFTQSSFTCYLGNLSLHIQGRYSRSALPTLFKTETLVNLVLGPLDTSTTHILSQFHGHLRTLFAIRFPHSFQGRNTRTRATGFISITPHSPRVHMDAIRELLPTSHTFIPPFCGVNHRIIFNNYWGWDIKLLSTENLYMLIIGIKNVLAMRESKEN